MSRQSLRVVVMGALALGLGAGPAAAQDVFDRFMGRPVAAVEVQVEGRTESSDALLSLVDSIKPGDRLTFEAMRRVVDRLSQVPRFESVSVLADERPSGLVLIFALEPAHPIDRLEVAGETGIPAADLERAIRDQFGGVPTSTRTGEVADTVRRLLRNEG